MDPLGKEQHSHVDEQPLCPGHHEYQARDFRAVAEVVLNCRWDDRLQNRKMKKKIVHQAQSFMIPPDHLLLDSAPNPGPLTSRWEINKFKNC